MSVLWGEGNATLLEAAMRRRQAEMMAKSVEDLPPENEAGNPRQIWGSDRCEVLRLERERLKREEDEVNSLRAQMDMFRVGEYG